MPGRRERGAPEAGRGWRGGRVPWPGTAPLGLGGKREGEPHPRGSLSTRSSLCIQVGRVDDGAGD